MADANEKGNPHEPVTGDELTRQWNRIRTRLAAEVKPQAFRSALQNPWAVGALAAGAGLAVGYVVGRRAVSRRADPVEAPTAQATSTRSAPQPLNPAVRRALEIGIDALAQGMRKSVRK